jgi:recombination protein RecT
MGKIQNKGLARVDEIRKSGDVNTLVKSISAQLEAALPTHIKSERFSRICMTALRKNPKLMECSTGSLLGALMECSQLGLEPGMGQSVHLVPFKGEVQVIIGYQGLVDLARRSGVTIHPPRVVREGDYFEVDFGGEREVTHRPAFDDTAPLTHVWVKATWTDSNGRLTTIYEVMSRAQCERLRDESLRGKPDYMRKKSPWSSHFDSMCAKSVVRKLAKMTPKSPEFIRAESVDGMTVAGVTDSGAVDFLLDTEAEVVGDE